MSGTFELGEATIEASAAVGAAVVPWAGGRADLLQLDSGGAEGLRVTPAAAGVEIRVPFGGWAEARIDTGTDWQPRTPGIGVELAEAQLGWIEPGGYVALRAGRTHIGFTSDRAFEQEDLALPFRPVVSRALVPLHANGADASVALPDRLSLTGGTFWAAPTSDAPHLWGRLSVTPLGPMPEREDADAEEPRFVVGAGAVLLRSASLGSEQTYAVDGGITWHGIGLDGGWVRQVETPDETRVISDNPWVAGRSRVLRFPGGTDLFVAGRYERVSSLVPGEQSRSIALARISWRSPESWAALYVEGSMSREAGPGLVGTGDVLDLERAERPNDWVAAGAWARW